MNEPNMMCNIDGNNVSATILTDFDTVRTLLQTNKACWGADVLQNSGEYSWRVSSARWSGRWIFGGNVVDLEPGSSIVWSLIGKRTWLSYHVVRQGEHHICITPLPYLPREWKICLVITLTIIFVVPVLLYPLFKWGYEITAMRASRVYLPAFCRYLQESTYPRVARESEMEKAGAAW